MPLPLEHIRSYNESSITSTSPQPSDRGTARREWLLQIFSHCRHWGSCQTRCKTIPPLSPTCTLISASLTMSTVAWVCCQDEQMVETQSCPLGRSTTSGFIDVSPKQHERGYDGTHGVSCITTCT